MSDVGKWCRRVAVDRPYGSQQTTWHLIRSERGDSVITECGRKMERVVHWKYKNMYGNLANHLEVSPSWSINYGQYCKRCA